MAEGKSQIADKSWNSSLIGLITLYKCYFNIYNLHFSFSHVLTGEILLIVKSPDDVLMKESPWDSIKTFPIDSE